MIITDKVESEILASVLQGKCPLDYSVLRLAKPEYFQVEAYKWLAKILSERKWEPIAQAYLPQLLLTVTKEDQRQQYETQINNLFALTLTFEQDADQVFRSYLAYCTIVSGVNSAAAGYKNSNRVDLMLRDTEESMRNAWSALSGDDIRAVDYAGTYEDRVADRCQERDNPDLFPIFKTGIQGIDDQFTIKGPMIINFLAPYKRYKSIMLNSCGYSGVLQNYNVFHVSYENTIELNSARYDAAFTGMNMSRVTKALLTQQELDHSRAILQWMQSWRSRLKLVKVTPKATTTAEIDREMERLRAAEGFVPNVIIIDYMNIMAPTKYAKEERLQQAQIVWDLKNLADKWDCPIITATQTKGSAVSVDRISMEDQGKAVDIAQGVDLTIAINQTPEEKESGIVVLSPLISRAEPITDPDVVLTSDLPRMLMCRSLSDMWQVAKREHTYAA